MCGIKCKRSYETSLCNHCLCCVNICSLWYPRKPGNCVDWLYLSRRGSRHSQWAWCHFGRWALIYSYSGLVLCATILSDDEDIKRESNRKLPDSTNLQRMEIAMERMSQKKTLITLAIGSCSHYPHGSPLPPCNYYRWVITTPMGHLMRILLHLSICLSLPSFELHFQIFQTLLYNILMPDSTLAMIAAP